MRDIRKISIGPDYKNGAMHYIVGQKVLSDTQTIHAIKREDPTGEIKVYIVNGKGEVTVWKEFNPTVPVSIEHNVNF